MKEKIKYQEKYRKGSMSVKTGLLPEYLPYMAKGTTIHAMFITSAGKCTLDGEEFEFQDVRVYTLPPP